MVAPAYVSNAGSKRRTRRVACLAIGVLTCCLAASGCARPVAVSAPTMTAQCDEVMATAPIRLLDALQRETSPAGAAALAWGDPPIVLVCGVDFEIPADAQILDVNGTTWVVDASDEGTVFTTTDMDPTVQLRVPASYRPEVNALTELDLRR